MELLGLHIAIWIVLVIYLAGMLLLGWWSKREASNQEGYLLGNRQFGSLMMVMHSFGAGTHPGAPAGVISKTVSHGASGIWVSWMWMFGTPFYWLIAPVVRRMRCLTLADYFEERYGRAASMLYVIVATVGMTIALAGILLATTRTVQGMMGKSEQEAWFFGILIVTTAVFVLYSFWGGIVAAIKTDMLQGLMIIALSFIAIPKALGLPEVGGLEGMRTILAAQPDASLLRLFDPKSFSFWTIVVLCINAPFSMMAQPHLMSVCAAGKTEWEGRVGFTYGNMLKRVCTMGWCILGLCWLAFLIASGHTVHPDAVFGDSVRALLPPLLQGIMLACVMAAAMSSGDALQVTVAGLFSQNVYRHLRPDADEERLVDVARIMGLVIITASVVFAILMRASVVKAILDYFNLTSLVGVSVVMGLLWRRMNTPGMFASTIGAVTVFILARYVMHWPRVVTIGVPLVTGVVAGIVVSLMTQPPKAEVLDPFFKKIHVPIGSEDRLGLPMDEAVPVDRRLLTAGGLFIVKPSFQSWFGFLLALALCLALVGVMYALVSV